MPNLVLGFFLGLLVCTVWTDIPWELRDWVNEGATAVAEATDPTVWETTEEALSNWRAQ